MHQARRAVFGESSEAGQQWVGHVLEQLSTRPFDELWQTLVQTRAPLRAKGKREALDGLMRYPGERREKVDYASFRAAGLDHGLHPIRDRKLIDQVLPSLYSDALSLL